MERASSRAAAAAAASSALDLGRDLASALRWSSVALGEIQGKRERVGTSRCLRIRRCV